MTTINDYFQKFSDEPEKEDIILEEAALELKGKDLETLKQRIEGKKKKQEKGKGKSVASSSFVDVGEESESKEPKEVPQKVVDSFWKELEKMDVMSLVSQDVLDAFKYIGFDPNVVMKELLKRGQKNNRNMQEIQKDIADMVTIAIIKGSITEKNLKKTSDAGKAMYKGLQQNYDLHTGGTKGKDSTHMTVARVAAAVPGMVIQILVKKPEYAKTFIGPFGSKALPAYLRHQAAAACIPEGLDEKLKEFVLGLITAYTADQSKVLSGSKSSAEELFDTQLNFVQTTHGSTYPSEDQRKKIFANFSLSTDYDKLKVVADKIKKVKTDFSVLTVAQIDELLAK